MPSEEQVHINKKISDMVEIIWHELMSIQGGHIDLVDEEDEELIQRYKLVIARKIKDLINGSKRVEKKRKEKDE